MTSKRLSRVLVLLVALAAFLASATPAAAAPGAYKVLIVFNDDDQPLELQQQIAAEPGVVGVDLFEADESLPVPTLAQLLAYDLVVDTPNNLYSDQAAYGNALADYIDGGGVLVQFAYDNWSGDSPGEEAGPEGRFESGGYAPFIRGDNENDSLTLESFDATSPLMQGVGPLTSEDNTFPSLAPGATLVAEWNGGVDAVAYKGHVVSVSAYVGGDTIAGTGLYGRLAVNAVRWLGRQTLTVANLNPAGGTVSGTGISCGPVCSAIFSHNTPVSLVATPNRRFAFAGFAGNCVGAVCTLTIDAPKSISANFVSFGTAKKVKKNAKKGTAVLSFGVGGPGSVVLSGKKVKKATRGSKKAGRVKLPIVARGKALKALRGTGKVRVKVKVGFTPTGGTMATFTKKVTLRLLASG